MEHKVTYVLGWVCVVMSFFVTLSGVLKLAYKTSSLVGGIVMVVIGGCALGWFTIDTRRFWRRMERKQAEIEELVEEGERLEREHQKLLKEREE